MRAVSEYWVIGAEAALDAAGLSATTDQIIAMARVIEDGHDVYGEATGQPGYQVGSRALDEPRKLKLRPPICSGSSGSLYGPRDEYWSVTDAFTGHTFHFAGVNAGREAKAFYEQNS